MAVYSDTVALAANADEKSNVELSDRTILNIGEVFLFAP